MIVLPLGAPLCFLDLLGGRAPRRGEPSIPPSQLEVVRTRPENDLPPPAALRVLPGPVPPRPLFTCPRAPTPADANVEAGAGTLEGSFYKNAYAIALDERRGGWLVVGFHGIAAEGVQNLAIVQLC
ncbi:hypothetical protein FIBSPDRAFT_1054046 [Athelia psychrophila]|uniref:Uncharacterized protein n=1 Tax=Athelia psychrophila TaxID=1759441 RepID=A0A167VYL6_9AGAM|nr:hypothetical protein FIBSPDRAFT_1054046 [Fibularhizoctonia sp. CBS 109695]